MAKRNPPNAPNPYIPSALDQAIEPGLVQPTSATSPAPAPGNSPLTMTPEQVAGAQQQTAQDQTNAQAALPSTSSAPTPYSTFNPTYSGDGGFNSSATANSLDSLYVYSGGKVPVSVGMSRQFGAEGAGKTTTMNRYEMVTGTTMMQRYQHMAESDPTAFKALQNRLVAAGYLTKRYADGVNNGQTTTALQNLLVDSSKYKDPTVTPDVLLQRGAADTSSTAAGGGTNSTYTRYNFSDPMAAQGIANNALQKYLGRNATAQEQSQFYAALHSAQQANPAVSTTTYTEDPNSGYPMPSKQVDSQAGFSQTSADQLAQDFAQSRPDYAETQAATTLMDEVFKTLGGKV